MSSTRPPTTALLGPWNPGITSTLPRRLYPRVTVFSADNAVMTLRDLEELAGF